MASINTDALPFVETKLNYHAPTEGRPFVRTYFPSDRSLPMTNLKERWVPATIYNARPLFEKEETTPQLDREGFIIKDHESKVKDFYDDKEVEEVYYPEIIELVKAATGAIEVQVFDHTLRAPKEKGRRPYVHMVHNDYTVYSGPQRLKEVTSDPERLADKLKNRFAIVNVWRPITSPVEEMPLAVSDARTLRLEDMVPAYLIYPERDHEIYHMHPHPDQKYFYFPQMHRGEALLFKVYDTVDDGKTSRFVAHSAFRDPTSPAQPKPRESIELRTIAFFGPSDSN